MNKKEKFFFVILIILLIIVSALKIWYTEQQKHTREAVIALIEENKSCQNYSYKFTPQANSRIVQIKRKDEKISYQADLDFKVWQDSEKLITIQENIKKAVIRRSDDIHGIRIHEEDIWNIVDSLKDEKYEYHFLRIEKYKGQLCYVIKLENKEDETEEFVIWINKENGLILKIDHSYMSDSGKKEYFENSGEYDITLNVITDEEMKEPDLSSYQVYDLR